MFCDVFQKKVTTSGDYSGSDEEEHDAYLEQMKAEGAERDEDDSDSEGEETFFSPPSEVTFFALESNTNTFTFQMVPMRLSILKMKTRSMLEKSMYENNPTLFNPIH